MKNRTPTEQEKEVIRRNGIDLEGLAVVYADENRLHLLRHETRDEILIYRGDKQW